MHKLISAFIFGVLSVVSISNNCFAQFNVQHLTKNLIPKSASYTGNIVRAVKWTDSLGSNIVLLTTDETRSRNAADESYKSKALYAFHFIQSENVLTHSWKIKEYIADCPVDLFLYHLDKTPVITDLDRNGLAEVWVMYKASCQGDVSPVPMKIIMYQGNKKYAARGTTKVQVSANEYAGGAFTFDSAFKAGHKEFRSFANKLWKQHQIEKWTK